jgi:hypothetical protein
MVKSSFALNLSATSNERCCNSEVELSIGAGNETHSDHEDRGCCGNQCHCACCVHVFLDQKVSELSFDKTSNTYHFDFQYQNNYALFIRCLIWTPPKDIH